jgi:putative membrane protein
MRRLLHLRRLVPLALVASAWAHPGEAHVATAELARQWSWEPVVVAALLLALALYAGGWWRMRRAGAARSLPAWQALCFALGWLVLAAALLSPLHRLGGVSLAVHMVQHELLMLIAAPLLVLGRPLLMFVWALPLRGRERAGRWFRRPLPAGIWAALSAPLAVFLLHGLALWIWHAPPLYSAALHNEWTHAAQHTAFLGTALLFWWTLIRGRYGRLGYGAAMVYVFSTAMHSGALGALLTLAPGVLYREYDRAVFGMSPLEDQQLAGLIMWVPAGAILVTIGLALVVAWMAESERRVRHSSADSLLPRPEAAPRA